MSNHGHDKHRFFPGQSTSRDHPQIIWKLNFYTILYLTINPKKSPKSSWCLRESLKMSHQTGLRHDFARILYRTDKIFGASLKFQQFSVSYFLNVLQGKCLNMNFILIWHVLNFNGQNISADKIFGSKSDFRELCPLSATKVSTHSILKLNHCIDSTNVKVLVCYGPPSLDGAVFFIHCYGCRQLLGGWPYSIKFCVSLCVFPVSW